MIHSHLTVETRPQACKENMIYWENFRVTVLTPCLFRVEKSEERKFCDLATQRVWYRDMTAVPFTVREGDTLTVKTERAELHLNKELKKSFVRLGDKDLPLSNRGNLGGTCRTLDNCDGSWRLGATGKERVRLDDGILSRDGVAVLDDSTSLLLLDDGKLHLREVKQTDLYVFAYGQDYRGAIAGLYAICGAPGDLPRYAFGNWWSRNITYTEKSYLHLMDDFRERGVTFTAGCIDMDWHWSHTLDEEKQISASGKNDELHGGNNGWTGYSWNTRLFPDPKRFLGKLRERGMHIGLNLHPADGIRYFEDAYPQMARAMGIDPATEARVPFDITDDTFINAYFDVLHHPMEEDGVAFWWVDWQQGTQSNVPGLDPLWSLNHYHYRDHARGGNPMILSRYAGIGSHRYPLGFSGDTYITWDSLDFIPYFTANASNAGYTWWSHDIGGFMRGEKCDELYVRYLQFGAFAPINRLHGTILAVVGKEPWLYKNGKGAIAESYMKLRHRMIPFLSSCGYETTRMARPLVEPMYYEYPGDEEAYKCKNQYLFGGQLLVRPVTHKGDRTGLAGEKVWLPKGTWTDIFTGDEYTGDRTVEMYRWVDSIPCLLREGGIFPLDARREPMDMDYPREMEVLLANGCGAYTLHEGEGDTWAHTHFESKGHAGTQTLTFTCEDEGNILPHRTYCLAFRNILTGNAAATANGSPIEIQTDDNHCLTVTLPDTQPGVTYEITVTYEKDPEQERDARLFQTLRALEGNNLEKMALWNELLPLSTEERATRISAYQKFTPRARRRLLEVLYSV